MCFSKFTWRFLWKLWMFSGCLGFISGFAQNPALSSKFSSWCHSFCHQQFNFSNCSFWAFKVLSKFLPQSSQEIVWCSSNFSRIFADFGCHRHICQTNKSSTPFLTLNRVTILRLAGEEQAPNQTATRLEKRFCAFFSTEPRRRNCPSVLQATETPRCRRTRSRWALSWKSLIEILKKN